MKEPETQDEWSRVWFDHVCERCKIPPHEERLKMLVVVLEEKIRFLEDRVYRQPGETRLQRWWRLWLSA